MTAAELTSLTLTKAASLIRSRRLSPVELTEAVLQRIGQFNGQMNAFITITSEEALRDARRAEREVAEGASLGPLHGVPVSLKDLYDTEGIRTTAGSRVWHDRLPAMDATAVRKLKAAGAVLIGKTNLHEFAFGTTSVNPHYGPVRNPWAPDRISGGSSGGSACAVALSMGFASLGTDTGGSIRIPASLCGIVGLKPTYGRVSLRGIVPLSPSLDHAGPMAKTAEDVALLLDIISGHDPGDPFSARVDVPRFADALTGDIRGIRIGVPSAYFFERLAPAVDAAVRSAVRTLERLGAQLVDVTLPSASKQGEVFQQIAGAEAYDYHKDLLQHRADDYGRDVRERLEAGRLISPQALDGAQRARASMGEECAAVMRAVDAIVTPTVPITAAVIGETEVRWNGVTEPIGAALTRYTRHFNLTGNPAMSIPCGFTEEGLPIGMQIAGKHFDEASILRIAHTYEQAAPPLRQPVAPT